MAPPKSLKNAKQNASKISNKTQKRKLSSTNQNLETKKKPLHENLSSKNGKSKSKQASKFDNGAEEEEEEEEEEEITKEIEDLDFNDALSAGLAFEQLNAYEGAIEAFQVALKFQPENVTVLSHLADAYMANEQVHKAIEFFLQAIRIASDSEENDDPSLWFRLAMAYENIEKFDPAIESYQKSLQVFEKLSAENFDTQTYSMTLAALSNCFGSKGDLDGAIQVYREATHKFPSNGKYHYNLATLLSMSLSFNNDPVKKQDLFTSRHIELTKKAYEKAIEFCPEEKEFYQDFIEFLQQHQQQQSTSS